MAMSNAVHVRMGDLGHFEPSQACRAKDVEVGSPAGLVCNAPSGYPRPAIHWMIKDGATSDRFQPINPSRATVDPDGTLWFPYVTLGDDAVPGRVYVCIAASPSLGLFRVGNEVSSYPVTYWKYCLAI
jgi:hypothetical protein